MTTINTLTLQEAVGQKPLRLACKSKIPGFDYKTSCAIGHTYLMPAEIIYKKEKFKTLKFQHEVNQTVQNDTFKSVFSKDLEWKYNYDGITNKANYVPGSSLKFMKPCAEKLKAKPPNPHCVALSEYNRQFSNYDPSAAKGKTVDLQHNYCCKIVALEKDTRMGSYPEGEGAINYLDPYNSMTHTLHHNILKREADFYKSQPIDVTPILSSRIQPVYDKCVMKVPFLNKLVHRPKNFVPHSGLKSETSSSFRLPLDEFVTYNHGIQFPVALHKASKAEILSVPSMYHTEYSHLNNFWPINAVVKQSNNVGIILCEPVPEKEIECVQDCFVTK
uniref:Uncharacterized protein n=1 Tax=Clastoptera arizonana TaxID=38151 RepID=A0A1B6CJS6_9HEMI